jgi:hypothetical protein
VLTHQGARAVQKEWPAVLLQLSYDELNGARRRSVTMQNRQRGATLSSLVCDGSASARKVGCGAPVLSVAAPAERQPVIEVGE